MAMVIDDRLKVWEDKDQPRVHVVPAFTPYYAPQAEVSCSRMLNHVVFSLLRTCAKANIVLNRQQPPFQSSVWLETLHAMLEVAFSSECSSTLFNLLQVCVDFHLFGVEWYF